MHSSPPPLPSSSTLSSKATAMPKILILHALLGSGHRSAAEAVGAALRGREGVAVRVEDALEHLLPLAKTLWTETYRRVSERAPRVYRAFYDASDAADAESAAASNLWAGRLSRYFLARIDRLVDGYRPDAVLCTMQFPLQLMSHMHHTGALRAPLYVAVTDFVPHGSWVAEGVSAYFAPSEATAEGFVRKGVPRHLIHVTGTPIRPEAALQKGRAEVRRRRGIPLAKPLVTLFGGGISPHTARAVAEGFLAAGTPCTLATVAGRNDRLEAALAGLHGTPAVTLIRHGAIDFVDDLLAASDLLIGKAGGLTTSEALARGVPMVMIEPLPGQEEWNADFVVGAGAGVLLSASEAAAPVALELLADPARLALMRTRALCAGRPHAARDVAEHILADLRVPLRFAA
jgi:processive 1,2-diacylglycerol beta-glucosyltransferase